MDENKNLMDANEAVTEIVETVTDPAVVDISDQSKFGWKDVGALALYTGTTILAYEGGKFVVKKGIALGKKGFGKIREWNRQRKEKKQAKHEIEYKPENDPNKADMPTEVEKPKKDAE